jgi:transcriptional regulator with XRE-family HTH domain
MPSFDPARLKEWRDRRALSQRDLADLANVMQSTIVGLEQGRHVPRPSTIRRLAKALKISPQELLRED